MDVLYGLHPVEEAVRSGSRALREVMAARDRRDARLEKLLRSAREAGVRVSLTSREELTRLARTGMHQGVLALVGERTVLTLEDLLRPAQARSDTPASGTHRFLLALDGVEDPHNLGALLRTADATGGDGVVLTERRSAPLSAVVAKSSAGAIEHVRIARVTNLVRSLEQLKQANFWVVGLDERAPVTYTDFDFRIDCVLVLGREGAGLHDLTRRTCDHLLRIPMAGSVASLNVSVAGAVVMFEALRQRRAAPAAGAQKTQDAETAAVRLRRGLGI